jgi:hypothetical protein
MRPWHLLPLAALLASCAETATYHEILARSKAEVSRRETWSDQAYIRVQQRPEFPNPTWEVTAGALDYSTYPRYEGPWLVSGTERKLHFTRAGCLVSYGYDGSPCAEDYYEPYYEPPAPSDGK